MKNVTTILLLLTTTFLYSQNDKVIGIVKSIREKTIFEKEPLKVEYIEKEDGTLIKRTHLEDTFISYGPYGEFFMRDYIIKSFNEYWNHYPYSSFLNYYMTFSKTGKKIDEIWYDKEDNEYHKSKNFYNEKDSLALLIELRYKNDTTKYFYNEFAKRSKITIHEYDDKKEVDSVVYSYNTAKKLTREDRFTDGKFQSSKLYIYDSNDNLIEDFTLVKNALFHGTQDIPIENIVDLEKHKQSKFEYFYDEKNRLITKNKYRIYENKLELFIQNFYEYDEFNNIIKISNYSNQSKSFLTIAKFSYKNNLIILEEKMYPRDSRYNSFKKFYYDEKNNIIKSEIKSDQKYYESTFKYNFDRKGNYKKIIKKTTCDGVTKKIILVREIKYYN